jgi:FkbM family methyltransferase
VRWLMCQMLHRERCPAQRVADFEDAAAVLASNRLGGSARRAQNLGVVQGNRAACDGVPCVAWTLDNGWKRRWPATRNFDHRTQSIRETARTHSSTASASGRRWALGASAVSGDRVATVARTFSLACPPPPTARGSAEPAGPHPQRGGRCDTLSGGARSCSPAPNDQSAAVAAWLVVRESVRLPWPCPDPELDDDTVPLSATVVIASRDRPSDLAACLSALAAQISSVPFDVIVVDDGSSPPVRVHDAGDPQTRVLRTPGIGPGQARNAGVRAATSDVVLFTDDDVVVDPAWVSRAVAYLEAHPDDAGVEGVVRSLPWDPLYENSIETSDPGHRWTCNIAYRRSALLAVGGFASGFPAAHCEDRDLGLRVSAIGPIGFEPSMTVTHTPRALTMRQMIRRGRLVASDIELERRHPGVFPRGRVPFSGRLMPPVRLARNWLRNATPGSPYRVNTLRRAVRLVLIAGGQVVLAAWAAWGPGSGTRLRFQPEVARPARPRTALASMSVQLAKRLARAVLPARLYRIYRQRVVAHRVARYPTRQVTHTYGRTAFTVELADGLAEGWYDHDWPTLPELERLRDHGLAPGARVFDIGAHQGVVALMLADAVGPDGHVLAVEAEPHNARVAERNRALNDARNLEVLHAAGAAASGSVLFAEGLNGHVENVGSRWGKVEVPAVTVDELVTRFGSPDIVLIDVEGFEGEVLAGAEQSIKNKRTTFLVEVHVNHGLDRPPVEILAFFDSSYRLLVAPAEGETDRFEAFQDGDAVLEDRFFLIAVPS